MMLNISQTLKPQFSVSYTFVAPDRQTPSGLTDIIRREFLQVHHCIKHDAALILYHYRRSDMLIFSSDPVLRDRLGAFDHPNVSCTAAPLRRDAPSEQTLPQCCFDPNRSHAM